MDIWFALFVAVVGLAAATGFSLALVGYINAVPAAVAGGRGWMLAAAGIPAAIVGVPVLAVGLASPFMEVIPLATLARWLAIPALTVQGVALARFLALHWDEQSKTAKQLGGGLLLMAVAAGLLYGFGPLFAERIVASVK